MGKHRSFRRPLAGWLWGVLLCLAGAAAGFHAPAADLTVYDDALRNSFQDWSWATHNLAQASVVHAGSSAISFEPDNWSGIFFHRDGGISYSQYDRLRFWVHGGSSGGQKITLALCLGGSPVGSVDVGGLLPGGTVPAGAWAAATVTFASLGVTGNFDGLWFMDGSGTDQGTAYVDDVVFLERSGPPPTGSPVAVQVDPSADRRAVSPLIYGVNFGDDARCAEMGYPLRRWGGNSTTRYSWEDDADNRGSDWFFFSYPHDNDHPEQLPDGSDADRFIDSTRAAGAQPLVTVPLIGWTARDRQRRWGFSVAKYGAQQETECTVSGWASWCNSDAGNGKRPDGTDITGNDPTDTSRTIGPDFVGRWKAHMTARTGSASAGGVRYLDLDNEPMLWNSTHRDVHPDAVTYDEIWSRTLAYAGALKAADPGVKLLGPVVWGWCAYFHSAADGCYTGADQAAHGGLEFIPWYLSQVKAHYQSTGVRLVDYLDVHFYPQASGVYQGGEAYADVRLRSVKGLYDPDYVDESWIGTAVRLIPRMRAWVQAYAPAGTGLAITEYAFGPDDCDNVPSAVLAEAEALAVFAREGVDLATRWTAPEPHTRGEDAFSLYLNYDGAGGRVEGESVRAVSADVNAVGAYAIRDGGHLYLLLFNKDTVARRADLAVTGSIGSSFRLYRFSSSSRLAAAGTATASSATALSLELPARSATLAVGTWSSSTGPLLGDLNNDGRLSSPDAVLLAQWLGSLLDGRANPFPAPFSRSDMNGDGRTDARDLVLLRRAIG